MYINDISIGIFFFHVMEEAMFIIDHPINTGKRERRSIQHVEGPQNKTDI